MAHDPLRGTWLAGQLNPAQVQVIARLRSTNEFAATQLHAGKLAAPALIAASRQTAGKGQHANRWWSDSGSVCATFVLPADHEFPTGQIPLRAGLAVAQVVTRLLPGDGLEVKWPNDVFINGRKLAGLLCARIRDTDIIGIGINVCTDLRHAPRDVRARATSLFQNIKNPPRRDELIRDLWFNLQETRQCDNWMDLYQDMHMLQQKRIRVETDEGFISGICLGIDNEGRLLVEADRAVRALTGGTVSLA